MSDIEKYIHDISNVSMGLFYPGFTKYLSDHPIASSRIYSTEKVFEQLKTAGKFLSSTNYITAKNNSIFKALFFDNKEDADYYDKVIRGLAAKRSFNYSLIRHHSTNNIMQRMYNYAAPYIKYRVSSPNTNRKILLKNYKFSIKFTMSLNVNKVDDVAFQEIKKFIWNFYMTEKYPVEDRMFQCFCLEYYFDKNDIVNQGIKLYFRSEEDAAQFSFGLSSLFGNYLDVF